MMSMCRMGCVVLLLLVSTQMAVAAVPISTSFDSVTIEGMNTRFASNSTGDGNDGDLWPMCWAEDGHVYAANGDGYGFQAGDYERIAVARISGDPWANNISGQRRSVPNLYPRYPRGIVIVNGDIYVSASEVTAGENGKTILAKSTDKCLTWSWSGNLFADPYGFYFPMFFDFGQNGEHSFDNYVYAFLMEGDWAEHSEVFLGRAPKTSLQDDSTWEFYDGMNGSTP